MMEHYFCAILAIGFTQSQFTVVEGSSVDISIMLTTSDNANLYSDTTVVLRASDDVSSMAPPAINLNRLVGVFTIDGNGDRLVDFVIPAGTPSGSSVTFTGIAIDENDIEEGSDFSFLLALTGFGLGQTSGVGIFGFSTIVVEDNEDGRLALLYICTKSTL